MDSTNSVEMRALKSAQHRYSVTAFWTHVCFPCVRCVFTGPLRGAMLGFYAGASDFTRRLTSVKANAKFSSPDAGEVWPVSQVSVI